MIGKIISVLVANNISSLALSIPQQTTLGDIAHVGKKGFILSGDNQIIEYEELDGYDLNNLLYGVEQQIQMN